MTRHEWKRGDETCPSFVVLVRMPPSTDDTPSATAHVEILDARFNGEERPMLKGTVRWDGCSDWHVARDPMLSLHFCGSQGDHGRAGLIEFGKVLAWAHELAQAAIEASGTECE